MRSFPNRLAVSLIAAVFFAITAIPAYADDFGSRFTIDLGPSYQMSGTGDAAAPPPAGDAGVGYTKDHPIANSSQFDYGLDFLIDKNTHLFYSHSVLNFNIGRVLTLAPATAFTFGTLYDRTDTIGLNRELGKTGVLARLYYYDHERIDVTGFCLNQEKCPNAAGLQTGNPASIDEHGYGLGLNYNFGPATRIGPLFTAVADAKYVPRPGTPPAPCGSCDGIGHYVGSQVFFPYSLSMKLPFAMSHTFIPFIGAGRDYVLFRDEATPEAYNTTNFGIVKVINKNLLLSAVNINYSGVRSSDTVPPPDNVRFSELLLKLDIKTKL